MDVVAASKATIVTVETRPDVVQLVKNRFQFLTIRQIQKPWQAEGENVEPFMSAENQRLNPVTTTLS